MGERTDLSAIKGPVLVTGGGGFVGQAVVRRLLELGIETRVVGRNAYPELEQAGVHCFRGDIQQRDSLKECFRGVNLVFHVAALAGIWGSWKLYHGINTVGTENVVECCRQNGVASLVYTSTPSVVFARDHIAGDDESLPYPATFLCHYAHSKALAEQAVLRSSSSALKTCALRPHLIWGPGDPHLLPRLVAAGRAGTLKKVGDGTNLVDISYIDNVADAHLLAAANLNSVGSAAGKAYFISQGEPVNLWDWINGLFAQLDVPQVEKGVSLQTASRIGGVLEAVYTIFRIGGEPRMTRFLAEQLARSHYFSMDSARKDLGYRPSVSTSKGLERTVTWLREYDKAC